MASRDSFLLRIDPEVLAALRQWSEDEMRSLNSQIEYLLRRSLQQEGRLKPRSDADALSGNRRRRVPPASEPLPPKDAETTVDDVT